MRNGFGCFCLFFFSSSRRRTETPEKQASSYKILVFLQSLSQLHLWRPRLPWTAPECRCGAALLFSVVWQDWGQEGGAHPPPPCPEFIPSKGCGAPRGRSAANQTGAWSQTPSAIFTPSSRPLSQLVSSLFSNFSPFYSLFPLCYVATSVNILLSHFFLSVAHISPQFFLICFPFSSLPSLFLPDSSSRRYVPFDLSFFSFCLYFFFSVHCRLRTSFIFFLCGFWVSFLSD